MLMPTINSEPIVMSLQELSEVIKSPVRYIGLLRLDFWHSDTGSFLYIVHDYYNKKHRGYVYLRKTNLTKVKYKSKIDTITWLIEPLFLGRI